MEIIQIKRPTNHETGKIITPTHIRSHNTYLTLNLKEWITQEINLHTLKTFPVHWMETYNFLDCGTRETFDSEPSELERVGWSSSSSRRRRTTTTTTWHGGDKRNKRSTLRLSSFGWLLLATEQFHGELFLFTNFPMATNQQRKGRHLYRTTTRIDPWSIKCSGRIEARRWRCCSLL